MAIDRVGVALFFANIVEQARRSSTAENGVGDNEREIVRARARDAHTPDVHVGLYGAGTVDECEVFVRRGNGRHVHRRDRMTLPITKLLLQRLQEIGASGKLSEHNQYSVVWNQVGVPELYQRRDVQLLDGLRGGGRMTVRVCAKNDLFEFFLREEFRP